MENLMTIAASKLFCGVAQEEVAALLASANARWRSCAQGEVILLAGSRARDIGVVCAGEVYVAREEITGERSLLARLGVGELFAEAYACAGTTRLPVSAIAAQDCQVLVIDCLLYTSDAADPSPCPRGRKWRIFCAWNAAPCAPLSAKCARRAKSPWKGAKSRSCRKKALAKLRRYFTKRIPRLCLRGRAFSYIIC